LHPAGATPLQQSDRTMTNRYSKIKRMQHQTSSQTLFS
jgi:hypothetical protein